MTEAEWMEATDPDQAILFFDLAQKRMPRLSQRKSRLFAIGCTRYAVKAMNVGKMDVRDMAERYADGIADDAEIRVLRGRIHQLIRPYRPSVLPILGLAINEEDASSDIIDGCVNIVRLLTAIPLPCIMHLFRDIFGNPFRLVIVDPSWLTSTVLSLAEGIYADRAFDRLPILADALQDVGCDNEDILSHCRQPGEHVRGCWAIDLLLGKS
jgi:hypothetical protein